MPLFEITSDSILAENKRVALCSALVELLQTFGSAPETVHVHFLVHKPGNNTGYLYHCREGRVKVNGQFFLKVYLGNEKAQYVDDLTERIARVWEETLNSKEKNKKSKFGLGDREVSTLGAIVVVPGVVQWEGGY